MPQVKVKVKKLKIDYNKLNKVLLTDPDLKKYMEKVASKAKEAAEDEVSRVRASKDSKRTPKQIEHGADYYDRLVTGSAFKGRKRYLASVWLNGNASIDYEAEHGVLEKSLNALRGKLGAS